MLTLEQELNALIRKYGTVQIIEELANITLNGAHWLMQEGYFNAEMAMRQDAAKLNKFVSESRHRFDRDLEREYTQ